jgi:hypothetical protein
LNSQQQQQFATWKAKNAPNDTGEDYDLQGAFLSNQQQASNGHFTDQFKKPNHPTFSTESQYSGINGETGGTWGQQNGKTVFYASPTNLKYHSPAELQSYFKQVEPDAILVLPKQQSLPAPAPVGSSSPQILANEPIAPPAYGISNNR